MTLPCPKKWLLLIHQIPPKPNALRVKIWRRLQQIEAVAIKQSVYVMPLTEHSLEDLSWTLKEILEGGGDGSISEAKFTEGLTDEQIIAIFQNARKTDYEKIITEANILLADWPSSGEEQTQSIKGAAQVSRLQNRLHETVAIDFFQASERGTAEILLTKLASLTSSDRKCIKTVSQGELENLKGKTWVTRDES